MKRIAAVFVVMGILVVSAYLVISYSLSTPGFEPPPVKNAAAATKPAESILDLRPRLVEKLQQLVRSGSNGLYTLLVQEVDPDLLHSSFSIKRAQLIPDTSVMNEMKKAGTLPDEIFRITTDSIRIVGLGLQEILSHDVIDVKAIHILSPVIHVYSMRESGKNKEAKSLYQRLTGQMKQIGIGNIIINNGTLVTHDQDKNNRRSYKDITVRLSEVLIDSATQYDRKRFLFAKRAALSMRNYSLTTANKLYVLNIGFLSINATQQLLSARNIVLKPNYSKSEFQKQNGVQKERYVISISQLQFSNTDWWRLINSGQLVSQSAVLNQGTVQVYLDRRMPEGKRAWRAFPHQLIMKLPLSVNIGRLKVNNLDVVYEERSSLSDQTGKVHISNLNGSITNLTNQSTAIKKNHTTTVRASGLFLKATPLLLTMNFDLSRYQTGHFTARVQTGKPFDGNQVNPIAEPLGMFRVKKGKLDELTSSIEGNNDGASGTIKMLYKDLHINPLERDNGRPGQLEKKNLMGFLANTFVIKNENPSKNGTVRKESASFTRGSGTFFNLVWKTTFVGILKTIGAPEKLATQ